MTNKIKCRGCGEYWRPEEGSNTMIKCCSPECTEVALQKHWKKENDKKQKSLTAARRKKTKEERSQAAAKRANSIKTRKRAAVQACHAYIRFRDKGEACICCGIKLGPNFQAGHWQPSNLNSKIRYHEDNIHGQRLHCNFYRGGDSGDYLVNLTAKIGEERVDFLLANKGGVVKRTADDYREIETYYKSKLKALKVLEST